MKSPHLHIYTPYVCEVKVAQSCPTLCNPMDYTVHGILQAPTLEWVVFPFSRGSSPPRSPALQADSLPAEPPGKPICIHQPINTFPMMGAKNTNHPTPIHTHTPYLYISPQMPTLWWGLRTPHHSTSPCIYTTCIHQPIHTFPMMGANNTNHPTPIHTHTPYLYISPQMPSRGWGPRTPNPPRPSPHLPSALDLNRFPLWLSW